MPVEIKVLAAYGGSELPNEDTTLRDNVNRFLRAAQLAGALTEFCDLKDHFSNQLIGNARPSKEIRPGLEGLAAKVMRADILALATPVHWRLPSMLMTAFVHLVLAPLEWGGDKNGGYQCKGKVAGIFVVFDDDGATIVASSLNDTLGHMGFDRPHFNTHHTNIAAHSSEDSWQKEPELLAPILTEAARKSLLF